MIILAMSICFTEDKEELKRLLDVCLESGLQINSSDLTLLSDRSAAIINAVDEKLPLVYHAFCPLHLERNLISKGFKAYLILFHRARNAVNLFDYNAAMEAIANVSMDMYAYLKGISGWQKYLVYNRSQLYGNKLYEAGSDNLVEQPFSWLLSARKLSPYFIIKNIISNVILHQQRCAHQVMQNQSIIAPYASTIFAKRFSKEDNNTIFTIRWGKRTLDGTATVDSTHRVVGANKSFQVDLQRHLCSCFVWQQTGIPCKHAIACLKQLQIEQEEFRYADFFPRASQ